MNIKYIKTLVRILPAILSGAMIMTTCFSSCTDELKYYPSDGEYEGEEISVPVSFSVLPIESHDPESRAVEYLEATDEEKTIHDIWILEYHENGTRIGLPRYYSGKDIPQKLNIIVPRRDCDTYTCVLIANSNDSKLFDEHNRSKFSTLDSLRTFDLSTHNHEHVFDPNNDKFLLMSAWTTITTDPKTHNLHFDLVRNVCKVNVKLTAFPDGKLVYKYFQWRDVPLGKAFPHGHIKYTQGVSRDWKQHFDDDPEEQLRRKELEASIDFYIPCNVWLPEGPKMPGNDLIEDDRTEDPTHFVVVARELVLDSDGNEVEGGEQYEFCLYPSKDKEKQFDFQPNLTIKWKWLSMDCLTPTKTIL